MFHRSTLVMLKYLEGKSAGAKLVQVALFTLTRAIFIGLLGVVAVTVGTAFIGFQKAAWIILGAPMWRWACFISCA